LVLSCSLWADPYGETVEVGEPFSSRGAGFVNLTGL